MDELTKLLKGNDSLEKILDDTLLKPNEKMYLMQELYGKNGRVSLDHAVSNFRDTGFFGSRNDTQKDYFAKLLKLCADYSSQA